MKIQELFEKVELLKKYQDLLIKLDFEFLDDSDNSGLLLCNKNHEIGFYEDKEYIEKMLKEIKRTIDK